MGGAFQPRAPHGDENPELEFSAQCSNSRSLVVSSRSGQRIRCLGRGVADAADEVEDADDIALRTAAVGEAGRVAGFRITALGPGSMHIK